MKNFKINILASILIFTSSLVFGNGQNGLPAPPIPNKEIKTFTSNKNNNQINSTTPRVLLLSTDSVSEMLGTESALVSTGLFTASDIDMLDDPAFSTFQNALQSVDVVFLWHNSALANISSISAELKNFVDNGGGVVIGTFGLSSTWQVTGPIMGANYCPFIPASPQSVSGTMSLASTPYPNHPVFSGLTNNPTYWNNSNFSDPNLNTGGILLANDTAGNHFLAVNQAGNCAGIVLFPRELDSGNAASIQLVANLLYFVAQLDTPDLSPVSTNLPISVEAGTLLSPEVTIANLDSVADAQATTVTLEVTLDGNLISEETLNLSALQADSSESLTFSDFKFYQGGDYKFRFYTDLIDDGDNSNDTLDVWLNVNGDIGINEFLPHSLSLGNQNHTEFIEIFNNTNQIVSLTSWKLENSNGDSETLIGAVTIPANDFFVLVPVFNPIQNGGTPFDYAMNQQFIMDNSTDYIVLKDNLGNIVDSVFYDSSWNISVGKSFEKKNLKFDSNDPNSWCQGSTIYGFENNKGTPNAASSCLTLLPNGYVSDAEIDYGNSFLATFNSIQVTIYSNGNGDLQVNSTGFVGNNFSTDLVPQTIPAGDSVNFTISFAPIFEGQIVDTLTISTDDWNTPTYEIALSGIGVDNVPPSDISDFGIISGNGTSATFGWTSVGDDSTSGTALSYEIRYSSNEIDSSNFASATLVSSIPTPQVAGSSETIFVNGLTSGTQYYFGIIVTDNNGNESNLVTASNFDKPTITAINDLANDNGGMLEIHFDASINDFTPNTGFNVESYSVFRKVEAGFSPQGKIITNQINETFPAGTWEQVATTSAFGFTNYTVLAPTLADSNSTGSHDFTYFVISRAFGMPWVNAISNVVSAHSTDDIAPQAPTIQNFTDNGNGTITANWSSVNATDLEFYTIYAKLNDGSISFVSQVASSNNSFTFQSLQNAVEYGIGSKDLNGNETRPFMSINDLKILVSDNLVNLSWSNVNGATSYNVYSSDSADLQNPVFIGNTTSNSLSFTNTNSDKKFYFVKVVW